MTDTIQFGDFTLNLQTRIATWHASEARLTAKECEILRVIGMADQPLTKSNLIEAVWSESSASARNRLMVALNRLKKKIAEAPCALVYEGGRYQMRTGDEQPTGFELTDRHLNLDARCVHQGNHRTTLTDTEVQLLSFLAKRPNQFVPRADVVSGVWGTNSSKMTASFNNHLLRLRRKLEVDPAQPQHLRSGNRREIGLFWNVQAAPQTPAVTEVVEAPFVGRADALSQLVQALQDGARCVTLVGPGGQGKTRLARQLMKQDALTSMYDGGVVFCDLQTCTTADGWVDTVAAALDLNLPKAKGLTQRVNSLGHLLALRPRTLVVLDNVEQLAASADTTLTPWIRLAGQIQFVVTSRLRLGLPAEQVYPVAPLSPQEAMTVFLNQIRRVQPTLRIGTAERKRLAPCLARLEGNTLAILLSAGQLQKQSFEDWANTVEQGQAGNILEQTLSRSWDLLTDWERDALIQTTVFQGGFYLDVAEEIVWPSEGWFDDVLARLLDHSLLYCRPTKEGEHRFYLYESVRVFAQAKMETLADLTGLKRRFVDSLFNAAEQGHRAVRKHGASRLDRWTYDTDNVWQALDWADDTQPKGFALLYLYDIERPAQRAARGWLAQAEQLSKDDPKYQFVRKARRNTLYHRGENAKVEQEILQDPTSPHEARVLAELNLVLLEQWGERDVTRSKALLEQHLQSFSEPSPMRQILLIRYTKCLFLEGFPMACLVPMRQAWGLAKTLDFTPRSRLTTQFSLGMYLLGSGHLDEAHTILYDHLAAEAELQLNRSARYPVGRRLLGELHLLRGEWTRAAEHLEEATHIGEDAGSRMSFHATCAYWGCALWFQGRTNDARAVFERHPLLEVEDLSFPTLARSLYALFLLHLGERDHAATIWEAAKPQLGQASSASPQDWDALWNAHRLVAKPSTDWEATVDACLQRPNLWLPRTPRPDPEGGHRAGYPYHWVHVMALEVMAQQKNPTRP